MLRGEPSAAASAPATSGARQRRSLRIGAIMAIVAAGLFALAAIGFALLDRAADHFVRWQAEETSTAWAAHIGAELERIEDIAHGAPLTPEEHKFLDGARQFGNIFLFKLFDGEGRLSLISDNLGRTGSGGQDLGAHNAKALRALRAGVPYTEIKDGRHKPDRPELYVETYVPVIRHGEIVAVSEVYVDQTETAATLRHDFRTFGLQVVGLTLLALLLPVTALVLMAREVRARNVVLDAERQRAVDAERAKAEFLAHMSHELRTPLNAIQGMSQMMVRGDLGRLGNAKYEEYAQDINDSANLLLSLINDILDLSKVEAGKYELRESEIELAPLIVSLLRITRGWRKADSLEICAAGVTSGLTVRADHRALNQILMNLLSNAVKFTPAGGTIDIATGMDDAGNCVISVRDTGLGIAAEDLRRVVEPFGQARRGAHVRHQEGTGLGLSLVNSLAALHGGALALESELGQGTTARVILPAERVVAPKAA